MAADPRANAAFELLGRSDRYAVILPLLKARSAEKRATLVARAVARLAAAAGHTTGIDTCDATRRSV
jgi:hypothetical protein